MNINKILLVMLKLTLILQSTELNSFAYSFMGMRTPELGTSFYALDFEKVILNKCINFDEIYKQDGSAPSIELHINNVTSKSELYSAVGLSMDADAQMVLGGGHSSFSSISDVNFDSKSSVWVINGKILFPPKRIDIQKANVSLSEVGGKILEQNKDKLQNFYSRCGSDFVTKEQRGVILAVVYCFDSLSQEEKNEIDAAFNIHGGIGVVDVSSSGNLVNITRKYKSNSKLQISYFQSSSVSGRNISELITDPYNISNVLSVIKTSIGGITLEGAWPVEILTSRIGDLIGPEISSDQSWYLSGNNNSLSKLYDIYDKLKNVINICSGITNANKQIGVSDSTRNLYVSVERDTKLKIEEVKEKAKSCMGIDERRKCDSDNIIIPEVPIVGCDLCLYDLSSTIGRLSDKEFYVDIKGNYQSKNGLKSASLNLIDFDEIRDDSDSRRYSANILNSFVNGKIVVHKVISKFEDMPASHPYCESVASYCIEQHKGCHDAVYNACQAPGGGFTQETNKRANYNSMIDRCLHNPSALIDIVDKSNVPLHFRIDLQLK